MQQCEVPGCRKPGQKHHIVFRSQGGLNIPVNYKYLCAEHHNEGKQSPHRCRETDLTYKKELQEKYEKWFCRKEYTLAEIRKQLGCRTSNIEKLFKSVPCLVDKYKREDIIRALMGGKLY